MNNNTVLFRLTCNHSRVIPAFYLPPSRRYNAIQILLMIVYDYKINKCMNSRVIQNDYSYSLCVQYVFVYISVYRNDEGMPFVTFVRRSLYPEGDNVSKDEDF
jgi:hypothetical protein